MSRKPLLLTLFLLLAYLPQGASAQEVDVLRECTTQSAELDDVHSCLDNYLDVMDGNIQAITDFLNSTLSGKPLAGLNRSQAAFVEYRRQNCLWYLDFSSPRSEAEQIAKNCLATMSQQRLRELQNLVTAGESSASAISGYFVFGADRNSFQPCGSSDRYWLEGDNVAVSRAQQSYLNIATSELQLLHAVLIGEVNPELPAPAGHSGVFELANVIELRVPTDSDCELPGLVPDEEESETLFPPISTDLVLEEPAEDTVDEQDEPEQQLTAYFGAWLVDCVEVSGRKSCELEVALDDGGEGENTLLDEEPAPRVVINRQPEDSTFIELIVPEQEIDSPARILWQVDAREFGDISESDIRVDESGTRQIVKESRFLTSELMPVMIKGVELKVDLLETEDDSSGEQFTATLRGLTKALMFADDFVDEAG